MNGLRSLRRVVCCLSAKAAARLAASVVACCDWYVQGPIQAYDKMQLREVQIYVVDDHLKEFTSRKKKCFLSGCSVL